MAIHLLTRSIGNPNAILAQPTGNPTPTTPLQPPRSRAAARNQAWRGNALPGQAIGERFGEISWMPSGECLGKAGLTGRGGRFQLLLGVHVSLFDTYVGLCLLYVAATLSFVIWMMLSFIDVVPYTWSMQRN